MSICVWDIETLGLNPTADRIISIGVKKDNEEIVTFCEENEEKIIKDFLNYINGCEKLIGFCSIDFDWQFVVTRAKLKYNLQIPQVRHIDLRNQIYPYNKFMKGSLRDFASMLNLKVKTENGSQMPALWANKEYDKIKLHNKEDCEVTFQLYKRCLEVGLLNK